MKSISIEFYAPSITIPVAYHHQVQGLIYSFLRDGGGEALHDESLDFGMRHYKLFTFSSLRGGKFINSRKSLYFDSSVYIDIRSVRSEFCDALLKGLNSERSIELFGQPLSIHSIQTNDVPITNSKIHIKMLSPLTLHRTTEDGYTEYINPLDSDFSKEINRNFIRKYYAFTGQKNSAEITIKPRAIGGQDRYLTLYKKAKNAAEKDIYITGWRGEYELSGRPEYLNFLYYCGLGARNSDGFGMFERI